MDYSSEIVSPFEVGTETCDHVEEVGTDELCRICATANEYLIKIFEGEGLENGLCDKINSLLPIKVSSEDKLTHLICYQCASHLLAWDDLRECSLRADKHLRNIQILGSQIKDQTVRTSKQKSLYNGQVQEDPMNTECSNEQADIGERSRILQHKKKRPTLKEYRLSFNPKSKLTRQMNAAVTIECNTIDIKLGTKEVSLNYNEDINLSGINNENAQLFAKTCQNSDIIECEAKESILSVEEFIIKEESQEDEAFADENSEEDDTKTSKTFSCQKCRKAYTKKSDLLNHLFKDHGDGIPTRTHNKLDREAVERAKVCVEDRVYYHCSVCGKNLHSPYTFSWHIRIHTGERPFICDLCGKQFRVSQGLARHLKETHEGIKKFSCDICNRHFATKRNVAEHRRIHTGERPYVCDLCGKSFKQKASLFVHNRSHTDIYPFTCSFCEQCFRTKPTLLIHETKHTGVKPYPCSVCGRRFRIKYELKRHMLIHSSEKPFSCKLCNISFRQKRYLRNHNKNNHASSVENS